MAIITDITNLSFQLASDFVNYTSATLFLTGKAGTGKTTFLKYVKENEVKNVSEKSNKKTDHKLQNTSDITSRESKY